MEMIKKNILKMKLLRNILIMFLSVAIALLMYRVVFIYPSIADLVIETTKNDAVRVARHLAISVLPEDVELTENLITNDVFVEIEEIKDGFELNRLKIFSKSGKTIFSTDPEDIGKVNKERYFHEIVAKGNIHASIIKKGTESLDGQKVLNDAVETYVPRMSGNTFFGAFEIYYDITDRTKQFDRLLSFSSTIHFILVFGLLLAILFVWFKENKAIIEHRRVEMALQESEEKLESILNSMPDIIIVVDRSLNIIWSNPVAVKFFDSDPVGKKYGDIFNFRHSSYASCCVDKCFEDGRSEECEIEVIGSYGNHLDLLCNTSVVARSEDGTPKSVMMIYRNITEKKLMQAETARAGQLASIGELAAGVAHEINNPINGIINCAQLLIDEKDELSEQTEISMRIKKAGSRIAMIVRNLLSFARDHDEEPALVQVQSVLSDSLDLTETQLRKDGIDLSVNIPDELPRIRLYSHKIQQVFLNIISNARYALNQKYPRAHEDKTLKITGKVVKINDNKYVRVIFHDHGTGIPSDIIDRICDPFFTSKPPAMGTGLGLSISHAIIKDHNGRLYFDSVEGEYSKIIIDLPGLVEKDENKDENSNNRG